MYKYTDREINDILKKACVIVDTREQKAKHITDYFDAKGITWRKEKLDFGDYTISIDAPSVARDFYLQDYITIERKANLEELSGNLAHERERMIAEFSRTRGTLILLVENATYDDILEHRYNTKYEPKSYIATLKSFEARFGFSTHFQKDNKHSGAYIYQTLIYHLRELLKKGYF